MFKNKIRIFLADDHPIMLNGIVNELTQAGYDIVGHALDGAMALKMITQIQPDVAIIDLKMPLLSGLEVAKRAKRMSQITKFIIMTYHNAKGFVFQAKKIGIEGYLLKEDDFNSVEHCINEVAHGRCYYSTSLPFEVDSYVSKEIKKINLLTSSERTVLRLIAQSRSSLAIGQELGVSKRTVDKHRSNIISKLALESHPNALIEWCLEHLDAINTM